MRRGFGSGPHRIQGLGRLIAVICVSAAALAAGCGSGERVADGPGGLQAPPRQPCPSGSPLPGGTGENRDYVDLVRLNDRIYYSASGPDAGLLADPSKLGAVLGTVRCPKEQHDSPRRSEPDWTDPGSTFVPEGSPIYAVTSVAAECQVAARSIDGKLHLYTAQPQYRPANCPP
jgi:hypothetical protein